MPSTRGKNPPWLWHGLVLLLLLAGCRTSPRQPELTPEAHRLQAKLLNFSDYFSACVTAAADDIADKASDRLQREFTLRWKIRVIPSMQSVVGNEDPRQAFVDAWVICARQVRTFEVGEFADVFGPLQPRATDAARALLERIESIGRESVPADVFAEAKKEVDAFAAGNLLQGQYAADLIRASQRVSASNHPGLFSLLSIPIGGLSESAAAIERVAAVATVFTQVVQDLPERLRWQSELFLLEAERGGLLEDAVSDLDRLSLGVESFAETAKGLPDDLRTELETLLQSSDATLQQLRATIGETRALAAEIQAPLGAVQETAATLDRAGTAWASAGTAVDAAMTTIDHLGDDKPPPEPGEKSFEIGDLTDAGMAIQGAALELRALLDDLESEKLQTGLAGTDAMATTSIDHATERLTGLVNQITVRALAVVLVFLVGLFFVRRATRAHTGA